MRGDRLAEEPVSVSQNIPFQFPSHPFNPSPHSEGRAETAHARHPEEFSLWRYVVEAHPNLQHLKNMLVVKAWNYRNPLEADSRLHSSYRRLKLGFCLSRKTQERAWHFFPALKWLCGATTEKKSVPVPPPLFLEQLLPHSLLGSINGDLDVENGRSEGERARFRESES
jgi:hypothetical protein